jgi:hypothetical protein
VEGVRITELDVVVLPGGRRGAVVTLHLAVAADATGAGFSWTAILLGVVLLVLNGGFVAVEIALLAARRTRVEEAADAGDRRARRAWPA